MKPLFAWDCHDTLAANAEEMLARRIYTTLIGRGYQKELIEVRNSVEINRGSNLSKFYTELIPGLDESEISYLVNQCVKLESNKDFMKLIQPAKNAERILSEIEARDGINIIASCATLNSLHKFLKQTGLVTYFKEEDMITLNPEEERSEISPAKYKAIGIKKRADFYNTKRIVIIDDTENVVGIERCLKELDNEMKIATFLYIPNLKNMPHETDAYCATSNLYSVLEVFVHRFWDDLKSI